MVRLLDVFFYGLFMDRQLLIDKGAQPADVRLAAIPGFALRIGARAAVVPDVSATVHGVVMKLSHADIERLYSEPSLRAYRPEPVLAVLRDGAAIAALCFNLPEPPAPEERNTEYAVRLRAVAERLGLPDDYVASIQ
jgi:gamma-glutamyl AIG2-like cyclotransferase